jgi:hypothetical protein
VAVKLFNLLYETETVQDVGGRHFIDFPLVDLQNVCMDRMPVNKWAALGFALAFLFLAARADAAQTAPVTALYWCPGKAGNEIQVKPGPGCTPLVQEKKESAKGEPKAEREPIKTEQLESEVTAFLHRYRQFLACCASDPASTSVEDLDELRDQASHILEQVLKTTSVASVAMARTQALISQLAEARERLGLLKNRVEALGKAKDKLDELDYEQAGRERRRIQEEERSISKEFAPKKTRPNAPTGTDIGGTAPTGTGIGQSAPTGTDVGKTAPTGSEIGNTPPTLGELSGTEPGPERNRENSLTTTQPVTPGRVGSDIGNSSPTGPDIGNSSLNERR